MGGTSPPRSPKCAHSGAFHEVVRLGGAEVAWGASLGCFCRACLGLRWGGGVLFVFGLAHCGVGSEDFVRERERFCGGE